MNGRLTQDPDRARLDGTGTGTVPLKEEATELAMPDTLKRGAVSVAAGAAFALTAVACTPTVQIAADKPITINLNVKIDQEIRYKIDKDLEDAIASNPDLF